MRTLPTAALVVMLIGIMVSIGTVAILTTAGNPNAMAISSLVFLCAFVVALVIRTRTKGK